MKDVKRKFIQFLDAFSNGLFIVKYIWLQYIFNARCINSILIPVLNLIVFVYIQFDVCADFIWGSLTLTETDSGNHVTLLASVNE